LESFFKISNYPDRTVDANMLKATGWTDITEMQNKIEEVLNKVG
jgi:cell division transport system ATP-binding protein